MYEDEQALAQLVSRLKHSRIEGQAAMVKWRSAAGVFAEKAGRGNRASLMAPTFTGKPKTLTIYEFFKDWAEYKQDANLSVHEALKELKTAVREADKAATDAMGTEEAIFDHLMERFGNVLELIRAREAEFASWRSCKGSYERRRDFFIHAKARLQNIVDLCTEHDVMDHLYDSEVHKIFQQKLDEDAEERLMDLFESFMNKAKYTPKKYVYPCLLKLCDVMITKMTTRVNMKANPDTAGRDLTQHKDSRGHSGAHAARYGGQDGHSSDDDGNQDCRSSRSRHDSHKSGYGSDSSSSNSNKRSHQEASKRSRKFEQNANPQVCVACGEEHPYMFYCEQFINAAVGDRFEMVKAQRSCARCLTMFEKFTTMKDAWWPDHDDDCTTEFACQIGGCYRKPRSKQSHFTICPWHREKNGRLEEHFIECLDPDEMPMGMSTSSVQFLP
jgi:hypothetical protein